MKKAFRMRIYPNQQAEYQKRHDEIWPEMRTLLKEHSATCYAIFLDPETNDLFAYLEIEDEAKWNQAAQTTINQKWWTYMQDIMETNADHSPITTPLVQVFEL